MIRKPIAPLAVVLALGMAGCSGRTDHGGGPETTSPTSSSVATTTTTTTTTEAAVEDAAFICQRLDSEVFALFASAGMAVGGQERGPAMRAAVAAVYRNFGRQLTPMATLAPENLRAVVAEWASASAEVAQYVTDTEPPPGIVVDFGPANTRWKAAEKAAEDICGHPLPRKR